MAAGARHGRLAACLTLRPTLRCMRVGAPAAADHIMAAYEWGGADVLVALEEKLDPSRCPTTLAPTFCSLAGQQRL